MVTHKIYPTPLDLWYRIAAFLLTAVFFLLPAKPEALALTVTQEDQTIRVEYANRTNRNIEVGGDRFLLEKEIDGQWESIPFREGFGFREIGHTIPPTLKHTFIIDPAKCFDEPLSPGFYRVIFYYDCSALGTLVAEEHTAAMEFELL